MKIGILTMPQKTNYGGLLQAYALQTVLLRLGHDVEILQRDYPPKNQTLKGEIVKFLLPVLYKIRGKRFPVLTENEIEIISKNTDAFSSKYFVRSPHFFLTEELKKYCEINGFEGYVVGSDQVWRPAYCPSLSDYYLGFTEKKSVKRLAYAVSFGVDQWEYTPKETFMCQALAKHFNAVGVREDSGVNLCSQKLMVEAQHVLDPTMLLDVEDYMSIALSDNSKSSDGELFFYLLDKSVEKQSLVKLLSKSLGYNSYGCMPEPSYRGLVHEGDNKYVFPSPAQWIRSFMDAKIVVTDSFHGTVFSILFNKPFWVLGNVRRGNTRMESLLRMFKLEHRLVDTQNNDSINWKEDIDWVQVNDIRTKQRIKSLEFLTMNLQ